ncbi:hypothetical protein DPMN_104537 [Dreissena polymorpha]|uniref:Uncharacterized protein n=1 Tax=Dreissena polymorpha TaxID=45954 RepID=A0A9D4K055_DREPO|nr:hypothetical protein DPMN_104537 [Dreissena polymorpha]
MQIGRVNVLVALKFQPVHVDAKFIEQFVKYLKTVDIYFIEHIVTYLKTQEIIKFPNNTWIETWSFLSALLSTHDYTNNNDRLGSLHFVVTFTTTFTGLNYSDLIFNITQLLTKPLAIYDANGKAQAFNCSLYPFDRWQLKSNSNNLYIPAWDLVEVHNTSCCSHPYQGITYSEIVGAALALLPGRQMFLSKLLFCEQIDLDEPEIRVLAPDNAILVGDTVLSKYEFRKYVEADGHIMYRVCISDASSIIYHDTSSSKRHNMCFICYVGLFVFIWYTML